MIEDRLEPEPEVSAELPLEDRLADAALAAMMGDPYEVGLRIALDDGVAAALPAVARELAVLDRAVGVVRSGLAGLAVAPVARVPPVPVAGAAGEAAAPDAPRPGASFAPSVAVSRGATAEPVAEAPIAGVLRAAERMAAPMLPPVAPLARVEGSVPDSPLLDWRTLDWPGLAAVPGVGPAVAQITPLGAVERAPGFAAPAAPGDAPVQEPAWPGAAWAEGAPRSAAPPALPPALLSPPDFAEPAAPAREEEPARDEPEDRVLEGRLEIDGALLGRFIAEHLAREAGRPPAGMTGFDPLLSPQWAGALQG